MVNPIRIKEYIFPSRTVNATLGSVFSTTSNYPLNGNVMRVSLISNVAGSMFILESGTNLNIFSVAVASGTAYVEYYPRTPLVNNLNVLIGGSNVDSRVINNNLTLIGSSFTSGTTVGFGPVIVNYI